MYYPAGIYGSKEDTDAKQTQTQADEDEGVCKANSARVSHGMPPKKQQAVHLLWRNEDGHGLV